MTVEVVPIPKENVPDLWGEASKYLMPALERVKHRLDLIDVYTELLMGHQTLWVAFVPDTLEVKAYATSKVFDEPKSRVLHVFSLGGRDMKSWQGKALEVFEDYGQQMGCDIMTLQGRKGWKLLENNGFEEEAVLYKKDLGQ